MSAFVVSLVCGKIRAWCIERLYILGPRYFPQTKDRDTLMKFLLGQAKMATWLTGCNRLQGSGLADPESLFKGLVHACLRGEYEYYYFVNDFDMFQKIWCVDRAVCSSRGTDLVIYVKVLIKNKKIDK